MHDAARPRRTSPVRAVQVLLPVWNAPHVDRFLTYSLPTLLAPGNLPAVAAAAPTTFVILTSADDVPRIRAHPRVADLAAVCAVDIRPIDHLITLWTHSMTLTLAYAERVRAAGEAMTDTCFVFLVGDYVMADGSLGAAVARVRAGASAVQAGNFQVTLETARWWLDTQLATSPRPLAVKPRALAAWALAHLHPATAANTVNAPGRHNAHANRLFWRAGDGALLGRFFLLHMLCIRPERTDFVVGSFCDYSFVPEMCPSGNVEVMHDSDDYLVVELQPRAHESAFLRAGPLTPRALARSLSEWVTPHHCRNARHSILFHAGERPPSLDDAAAEADRFLAETARAMAKAPRPERDHPYWQGGLASHKEATSQPLTAREWRLVLGVQMAWAGDWLADRLVRAMVARPPRLRRWHPLWADCEVVLRRLEPYLADPEARLLMVSDVPTIFTVSLADGGARATRLEGTRFLRQSRQAGEPLRGRFDVALVELKDDEAAGAGALIDGVVPLMKRGGAIVVRMYNRRLDAGSRFSATIASVTGRLARPAVAVTDAVVLPASRPRLRLLRAAHGFFRLADRRRWVAVPALAAVGGVLTVASGLRNLTARGPVGRAPSLGQSATSFMMVLRVDDNGSA